MYKSKLPYSIAALGGKAVGTHELSEDSTHFVQQTATKIKPRPQSENFLSGKNIFDGDEKETTYNVLQVEDNAENRFIVHRYLKKSYNYDSVEHGEHAIEMVKNNKYDVILMDINLGAGIDGIETIRRIRQNEEHKDIAVIAVTANVNQEIRNKCREVGMDAFLAKPFRKEELTEIISKALEIKKNGSRH